MSHPEGSQGQRSAWEPCPPREAPSYRPPPQECSPGLGTHMPKEHPPTFLGCRPGLSSDWALIGQGLKRRLWSRAGTARDHLEGFCLQSGECANSLGSLGHLPGPPAGRHLGRPGQPRAPAPTAPRLGPRRADGLGGPSSRAWVGAGVSQLCMHHALHGRRCRPGGSQALLGKVMCGDGCTALPGPAVGNLNPGRGLNQGLTQGPRHHGTSEPPWLQARPAGQPAATRVSHRTRACPPCGCLAPEGPGLSPLPSPCLPARIGVPGEGPGFSPPCTAASYLWERDYGVSDIKFSC